MLKFSFSQLKVVASFSKLLQNSCRSYRTVPTISSIATRNTFPLNFDGKQIESMLVKPTGLNIGIRNPNWKKEIFEIPTISKIIENPVNVNKKIEENSNSDKIIDLPAINDNSTDDTGKQAARLIVIRRRMMKKHKLKKLRKKMKFEWAKVRQRRELRKEKKFQAKLINQIKEAEKFSAEHYVLDKIRQATETPIPRYWKGRRLPEFIIKEKLGLK